MKILSCVFPINLGKPLRNAESIMEIMDKNESDIYLFPAYAITGSSCGQLFSYKAFNEITDKALEMLCEYTEKSKKTLITSIHNSNIIISKGDLNKKGKIVLEGKTIIVSDNGDEKADIILLPTAMPGYPCIQNDVIEYCAAASLKKNCVIAVANSGFGESVSDNVYKGFAGIFKNGVIIDFFNQDKPEIIYAKADYTKETGISYTRKPAQLDRIPYYGKNEPSRYLSELFLLQTEALYSRLKSSGIKKVAINISGGLDSTLALLVADNAMKMAELPAENIIALTLPGFGTSERTKKNAKNIMNELKTTSIEINIKDAVTGHLKDIGHDIALKDVVYENAQARERAQVLFDVANKYNALALGTGDMSEAALGFCTFAGDTLCHYNVNATVPKTLVRETVKLIASKKDGVLRETLLDITETPISPELKEDQKTEDIIGPYILHDFFMYYFAKHKLPVAEIEHYALATFEEYSQQEIDKWLEVFFTRFSKSQYKRSSAPEGANIIGFILPYFPTDLNPEFM
ncbi:MAG: synthetase [Clostridia bacterium]|nr:synthetase [Clostridia bacterium]